MLTLSVCPLSDDGYYSWFFFQDALNGGTNALLEYNYLVKKVVFKISILPIVKIISPVLSMFFSLDLPWFCAADTVIFLSVCAAAGVLCSAVLFCAGACLCNKCDCCFLP